MITIAHMIKMNICMRMYFPHTKCTLKSSDTLCYWHSNHFQMLSGEKKELVIFLQHNFMTGCLRIHVHTFVGCVLTYIRILLNKPWLIKFQFLIFLNKFKWKISNFSWSEYETNCVFRWSTYTILPFQCQCSMLLHLIWLSV